MKKSVLSPPGVNTDFLFLETIQKKDYFTAANAFS